MAINEELRPLPRVGGSRGDHAKRAGRFARI